MTAKLFFVPEYGYYLYDGLTNRIITAGTGLSRMEEEMEEKLLGAVIEAGIVSGGALSGIAWREPFHSLKHRYENCLKSLILQVTRDCNLRCSYCAYSGNYRNMLPHSKDRMTGETIRRSIRFFMEHSKESPELTILFYGGEPLLEFCHLKMAVRYARGWGRNVRYGITSNGVGLSPEVAGWLSDNPDVYMTVTLNGPRHDEYRKTVGNGGSLQAILDNIFYIRDHYPDVWENQIRFIANIVSARELPGLREFYGKVIGKQPEMVSNITFEYCDEGTRALFKTDREADEKASGQLMAEYAHSDDPFLGVLYDEGINMVHNRGLCGEGEPGLIQGCMPMSWRLFVRTDGTFNMCERVSDGLSLGNLEDGFDENRIEGLYLQMKSFAERNCRDCWAQRLCMYCYQDVLDENGGMASHFPREWCSRSQKGILEYLKMYVRIANQNPGKLEWL